MPSSVAIEIVSSLENIQADAWNALNHDNSPFLRHEFLVALERHEAVGEKYGWLPCFLIARDTDNNLAGAMPLYEKNNSYGELVFDWSWADAYHRHGISYYPKLVSAIPYTPATGKRLLTRNNDINIERQLMDAALDYCQGKNYSGIHYLFPTTEQCDLMRQAGLFLRQDIQYHWHNRDYANFDQFLGQLRNTKRKKIKQERRKVRDSGVRIAMHSGNDLSDEQWHRVYRFYANTFAEKNGYATLNAGFWREIGSTMGEQLVISMAYLDETPIACAINFQSDDVLYGRHWGCQRESAWQISGLHFETCYYSGIEYAIKHRLSRFEPGAQGEYKMSRGFDPSFTYSAHWLTNTGFRNAIQRYVRHETQAVTDYQKTRRANSPFRNRDLSS